MKPMRDALNASLQWLDMAPMPRRASDGGGSCSIILASWATNVRESE